MEAGKLEQLPERVQITEAPRQRRSRKCFYHGTEPWMGPHSLRDMMEFGENAEKWKELFVDYQMIFVDAGNPSLAANCQTDLRLLLDVLRLRGNKERMLELLQRRDYDNVSKETAETIAVMRLSKSLG